MLLWIMHSIRIYLCYDSKCNSCKYSKFQKNNCKRFRLTYAKMSLVVIKTYRLFLSLFY